MSSLNIYSINENTQLLNFIKLKNTHLKTDLSLQFLNMNKNNFDLLEKFVYDSSCFQLKQLLLIYSNLDNNINNYNIEFWIKNEVSQTEGINVFHVDCDETKKKKNKIIHPLLSCVTYLNDSEFPLLLTDINHNDYLFKEFENKNKFQLIFPKENTQISFDGSNYHGVCDIFDTFNFKKQNAFERHIISINLWKEYPSNMNYYETKITHGYKYNKEEPIFTFDKNENNNIEINIGPELLTFDFYETMLYNSHNFILPNEISKLVKIKYDENYFNFSINLLTTN